MIIICITLIIIHCFSRDFIAFIIFLPAEKRKYNKMMFITMNKITNVVCVIIPMLFHLTSAKHVCYDFFSLCCKIT